KGGKNASGTYQTIINIMPPHKLYIEGFTGSGAIYFNKERASISILIDKGQSVIQKLLNANLPGTIPICTDAISFLNHLNSRPLS
ncbi:MAG: hypothetical protein R2759_00005, partial [Bacteroidales bacterium]